MEIISDLKQITNDDFYLTIGNFDGVHLGHRYILDYIKKQAIKNNYKVAVITFVPHPKEILEEKKRFLLASYEFRRRCLDKLGVDYLVEMHFHRDFSTTNPETFLTNDIFCTPKIKKFFLGHDFAFGRNKCGDQKIVIRKCQELGVEVEIMERYFVGDEKVSSSIIRKYLSGGDIQKASKLLGRNYELSGNIVKGAMRGRLLGFPTANLNIPDTLLIPPNGVYITKTDYKDREYYSLTNVGYNPTFNKNEKDKTIEVHILDFNKDIYGEVIRTYFIEKIRDEIKFKSKEDLISQIKKDIQLLKDFFPDY